MKAGKLRHRILIQKKEVVRDEYNEEQEKWVTVCSCRAEVNPLQGKEFFAAQQINNKITVKITMRYRNGISTAMRIIFKKRIFNILVSINPLEKKP
ncbi:phage head closure protein [Zooshikella ganghwensis]|uniref:Head-tail adaptor protein n=1 Tax=Zooshikella ganghwensis TaxID=202772 RepID=A0A4P9VGV2_9GAMM|nr:phage head closure protein [Zooshikella ganghwensis]RDH41599.1 head-tail adaptor protein [Zooshikella ganghwensis]